MRIYGKCNNCENEIGHFTSTQTRVELAMQGNEIIILSCKNCKRKSEFHVDDLVAKESKLAQLISGLILFIGTPLIFYLVNPVISETRNHYAVYIIGSFLLVPVIVFGIIKKQDQTRVSSFNRSNLKGKIHNKKL